MRVTRLAAKYKGLRDTIEHRAFRYNIGKSWVGDNAYGFNFTVLSRDKDVDTKAELVEILQFTLEDLCEFWTGVSRSLDCGLRPTTDLMF